MKQFYRLTTVVALLLFFVGSSWGQNRDAWTEDFNDQTSNTYNNTSYTINGRIWTCSAAGNFSYGNSTMGSPAFVINDDNSNAHITTPVLNTCGTVGFKYAYKSGSSANVFVLQKSTDGTNFTNIDTHTLGASAEELYVNYSFDVNDASTTLYIRILSDDQNAHLFIDDFTVTNYSSTPSAVALSDNGTQIAAANVNQGSTDVILHQSKLAVTLANATLTGMTCTTSGNYVSDDITNLKVRYSADATLDGADATLSTLTTPGTAASKIFPSFTPQTIDKDETGYIFITSDIANNATHGNTISINAITTSDLTIANTTLTGSTTAGGVQTIKDVTGPSVSAYNPLDDATEIAVNSDLVLTFNENIQKGTGNITIKKISDNSIVQTIAVTSDDVSITDATLTINPNDLVIGTKYYIEIAATVIEDMQGNAYAGISGTETWNFTTVEPSVTNVTSTNANDTYKIGDEITVTVSFNDNVTVDGSPYILLEMVGSNRQASYSTGSGTSTLSFTYTIQSTDETSDLDYVATNSLYENGGSIKSSDGVDANRTLATPGDEFSLGYNKDIVVDGIRPTVSDYSPADGSSNVSLDQNLVLTFSETIQQGTTGNVVIWNGGGTEFETIPYDDSRITISTNTVTINPTGEFSYASEYYVKISNNVFTDINGNSYTGITDEATWNFTTEFGPITSFPWDEDFESGTYPPAGWTVYMADDDNDAWEEDNSISNSSSHSAVHNYTASGTSADDWFISRKFDLSGLSNPELSYYEYVDYSSYADQHNVMYSTNYIGSGDPALATWTNINITIGVEDTWVEKGVYSLPSNSSIYIAFQYTGDDAANWYIDDISVIDNTIESEPSNHPTNISATVNSSSSITINWSDAIGGQLPSAYLVKAAASPDPPTAPSDRTAEDDGTLVKNIAQGVGEAVFTGLDASTEYNFSIWPYTNSGDDIDYKTDGTVPTKSATTGAAPIEPQAGDLVITEISGDGVDGNSGNDNGFMEVYNTTSLTLSLDKISARYYNLNPGDPTQTVVLSGDISPYGFIVITQNEDNFNSTYTPITADFAGSNFYFNGGDDGCDIYHSTNGVLDQFNDNGSGQSPWDWEDNSVWERTNTGSGATNTNWTEYAAGEGTPKALLSNEWTGSAGDNLWNTAANWGNFVPGAYQNVTIPSGKASIVIAAGQTADCYNLTIEGSLTIQSDATGMGSLITNGTVSGTATYNLYVSKYDNSTDYKYHYISSPVTAQAIQPNFVANTPATDVDFLKWEPQTGDLGTWINTKNETSWNDDFEDNFVVGRGYMVAYPSTSTKAFTGTLNTGDINLVTTNSLYQGWNLIGNPYPSYLDWDEVASSATNMDEALYYYDNDNEAYNAYIRVDGDAVTTNTATKEIPPLQGFMVYSSNASGQALTLTNSQRIHGTQAYFKEEKGLQNPILKLTLQKDNRNSEMAVVIFNKATEAYDSQYDAFKILSYNQTIPEIYSLTADDTKLAINTRDAAEGGFIVPVSVKYGSDGDFAISVSKFENLEEWEVVLEDKAKETFTELSKTSTYTFTASTTDASDRFLLHFKSTTAVEDMEALEANIYAYDGKIYISGINQMNNVRAEVLSVDGRTLYTESYHGEAVVNVPGHFVPGCYLVRLSSEKAVLTKKLIIR